MCHACGKVGHIARACCKKTMQNKGNTKSANVKSKKGRTSNYCSHKVQEKQEDSNTDRSEEGTLTLHEVQTGSHAWSASEKNRPIYCEYENEWEKLLRWGQSGLSWRLIQETLVRWLVQLLSESNTSSKVLSCPLLWSKGMALPYWGKAGESPWSRIHVDYFWPTKNVSVWQWYLFHKCRVWVIYEEKWHSSCEVGTVPPILLLVGGEGDPNLQEGNEKDERKDFANQTV